MVDLAILQPLARNWWMLLIRGIVAIILGILAFALPGLTLLTLVLLFGAYAILDGITALVVGSSGRSWMLVLAGVLGIIVGILTFVYPIATLAALYYLVAAWAIATGVFEIIAAVRLRKEISNEWLWVAAGALSILLGVALVISPAAGLLTLVWLIGAYALFFGVVMIVLAFRLRRLKHQWTTASKPSA